MDAEFTRHRAGAIFAVLGLISLADFFDLRGSKFAFWIVFAGKVLGATLFVHIAYVVCLRSG